MVLANHFLGRRVKLTTFIPCILNRAELPPTGFSTRFRKLSEAVYLIRSLTLSPTTFWKNIIYPLLKPLSSGYTRRKKPGTRSRRANGLRSRKYFSSSLRSKRNEKAGNRKNHLRLRRGKNTLKIGRA